MAAPPITTPSLAPQPLSPNVSPPKTAPAEALSPQAAVARALRPRLPASAFSTNPDRLGLVAINLAILALGWVMADRLDQWPALARLAFLPFALVMGNSVVVLLFSTHDLLHGRSLKGRAWRRLVGLAGLAMLWMPPSLWQAVHNREHHGHTNALADPDRGYLESQPQSWGKGIQDLFVPSQQVSWPWLVVGLSSSWGVHNLRLLLSVLLRNDGSSQGPAGFRVSHRERRAIGLELALIALLHLGVLLWLDLNPLKLLLGYFLPIWIGYGVAIAYIFTNHMLCPLSEVNDPLDNSLSLQMPQWLDLLHLNFSHHTEHHLFPDLDSSHYPLVRQLLIENYGESYQLVGGRRAWSLLMATPRLYRDATTLVGSDGRGAVTLPDLHISSGRSPASSGDPA
ncbi:fatty acid desaturase family protein [Cyanobium sp. ATX 6F1]|uniref:fatty acid desaturase family protein n=1 Tax=Cyanobium sp. ATX 6F1 TaxID=2823702 RepID=UPI0020CF7C09|nr:fatty acid desaturase [Cyanobium sp. ATX 6F1]MCP9914902.1 fatty acid desaturase [Cyanobium sp. ATX 6F1]